MKKLIYITILALTFMSMNAPAPQDGRNRLKSLMLYQFATQIDWPKEFKTGTFLIGVYGNESLYDELVKNHSGKTVGSQPIKIVKFNTVSDIKKCHILYVAEDKSSSVKSLASKFKSKSTLVISESPEGLENGAVINFFAQNNRTVFELSKTNAQQNKLIINSRIVSYAANVK